MRKFEWLLLLLALPLIGRAQTTDLRTAAGCGPTNMQFNVKTDSTHHAVNQPEPGHALVYVIVQGKPEGGEARVTTRVGLDGNWVGASHGASYLSFPVIPGDHHVCTDWQSSLK